MASAARSSPAFGSTVKAHPKLERAPQYVTVGGARGSSCTHMTHTWRWRAPASSSMQMMVEKEEGKSEAEVPGLFGKWFLLISEQFFVNLITFSYDLT